MNERNKALMKLSAVQFTLLELHMYLDTHPYDKQAQEKHDKNMRLYEQLKAAFVEKYGPLKPSDGNGAEWLRDPWPWDIQKECDN